MNITSIMAPELMRCHPADITSKKQVLKTISELVSDADNRIKYQDLLEALQKREKLGSTAIGYGVAIPHARVKNLNHAMCVLLTLQTPVDFDNPDEAHNEPIDLVVALLVPEEATQEHLDILGEIATRLKNKTYREHLMEAKSNQELFKAAIEPAHAHHH